MTIPLKFKQPVTVHTPAGDLPGLFEGLTDTPGVACVAMAERDALKAGARWIPCSERMPEDEARTGIEEGYIVFTIYGNQFICAYWEGHFRYDGGVFPEVEITHWRELPDPPNGRAAP